MLKRLGVIFGILLVLVVGVANPASAAYTKFSCNSGNDCQGINLSWGSNKAYSNYIFASAGKSIFYDFTTDSRTGMFQTKFWVENSSGGRVSAVMGAAPYGGNDYAYFNAPRDGYYRLVTECPDGVQERCSGRGHVYRY